MFGRAEGNQQQTFLARQVLNRDAGFRNFVAIGSSRTWLSAANITLPFPFKLPIGFYTDCAYGEIIITEANTNNYSYETKFLAVGGLYVSIAKNVFEIYLPLFASQNVMDVWQLNNGFEHPFNRASFILNLNAMNPIKLAKNAMK